MATKKKIVEPTIVEEEKIADVVVEEVVEAPVKTTRKTVSNKENYIQIAFYYSPCRKNYLRIFADETNKKFKINIVLGDNILRTQVEDFGADKIETLKIIIDQHRYIGYKNLLDYIRTGDFAPLFNK